MSADWIEAFKRAHVNASTTFSAESVECPACAGSGYHGWVGAWYGVGAAPLQACSMCRGVGTTVVVRR